MSRYEFNWVSRSIIFFVTKYQRVLDSEWEQRVDKYRVLVSLQAGEKNVTLTVMVRIQLWRVFVNSKR